MTINIPCWTTSKEEADKLVDELSEGCYEYGKDESKEKMLDVFYKTKMLKNYVGIMQGRIELLTARIAELEAERDCLAEKVADLEFRMDIYNSDSYEIIVAENKRYLARIAGLEGLIDQLIEIGKGLDDGYEHYRFSEQTIPLMKLRKLTADWKEREE